MSTMFYQGSLQEGIALAVSQAKAVTCFVRDNEQQSMVWENEYFAEDGEFARFLEAKAITLRLTQGSHEAGFLTSFCPIAKLPAVVVIKNGMLREYIIPDVSKEDFRGRLRAVLDDTCRSSNQVYSSQSAQTGPGNNVAAPAPSAPAPAPQPATSASPAPSQSRTEATPASKAAETQRDQNVRAEAQSNKNVPESAPPRRQQPKLTPSQKPQQKGEESRATKPKQPDTKKPIQQRKETQAASSAKKPVETEARPKPPPGPPKQYRLQVRLFDGSSVRSSFTPSQNIRKDVRPWLDEKMTENTPYNLKHILTPLPNRTLTIADEELTLQELNLGATANLVMIPIRTYTEAYSDAGPSLPMRAANTAYDMASSAFGTATGLVGSFFGYGQTAPASSAQPSPPTGGNSERSAPAPGSARPPMSRGPNIRTLHDARRYQDNSQFYNGNQLNFEPRGNPDQR